MMRMIVAIVLGLWGIGSVAVAQDVAWVQVEAQPNLRDAEARARSYGGSFADVSGYQLASGWYAIVLGPFPAADVNFRLEDLRASGRVPGDSYVADGRNFRQRFWPVGAPQRSVEDLARRLAADAPAPVASEPTPDATAGLPDETPTEARRSESGLDREARELLQTAMLWTGDYSGTVDGAIGPGTRTAMASWQQSQGLTPTGVLTTGQRATLVAAYRADLARLGLSTVRDEAAGIAIDLPTALVAFDRYEPPFAHYEAKDGSGVRVLLISEAGDAATLAGLYDVMQTLEIVPAAGDRHLDRTSFVLSGASATRASYTYAAVADGAVKGFTLVWDPAKADTMPRVLDAMKASFRPIPGLMLDPGTVPPSAAEREGLLAGLRIRAPKATLSGFYVDGSGRVLTAAAPLGACGRITLDGETDARIELADTGRGVAVLAPATELAPPGTAVFGTAVPPIGAEVAVAGYSYGGALPEPAVTFGTLSDLTGLAGETDVQRLSLEALPGDTGGPVLDDRGAVIGMLLPREDGARQLPASVALAADATAIRTALASAGITIVPADGVPPESSGTLAPEDLSRRASAMTVLVSCWE